MEPRPLIQIIDDVLRTEEPEKRAGLTYEFNVVASRMTPAKKYKAVVMSMALMFSGNYLDKDHKEISADVERQIVHSAGSKILNDKFKMALSFLEDGWKLNQNKDNARVYALKLLCTLTTAPARQHRALFNILNDYVEADSNTALQQQIKREYYAAAAAATLKEKYGTILDFLAATHVNAVADSDYEQVVKDMDHHNQKHANSNKLLSKFQIAIGRLDNTIIQNKDHQSSLLDVARLLSTLTPGEIALKH